MEYLICLIIFLLVAICMLINANFKLIKENEINYSNYKNTLRALASHDPGLAKYIGQAEIQEGESIFIIGKKQKD